MNRVLEAIAYAESMMKGLKRKHNGRDYFRDHCMKLLADVASDPVLKGDEDAAIIIINHDVVEDCTENDTDEEREAIYQDLMDFGTGVVRGVKELTDEYTKKRHPDKNRRERKALELKRLCGISDRGKHLKLYDRNLNLDDTIAEADWNMTYAQESWDIGFHLASVDNNHVAAQVMAKAAFLRDKCNEQKKRKKKSRK